MIRTHPTSRLIWLAMSSAFVYFMAPFYLLMGSLGFGLRVGANIYAEEDFGPLRTACLILLTLLICGGFYYLRRSIRRPV